MAGAPRAGSELASARALIVEKTRENAERDDQIMVRNFLLGCQYYV